MIEHVVGTAIKTAVTESVKETAGSSAVKEGTSLTKDISSKGQDIAQERLSRLEAEAVESSPEDYESYDIAKGRLECLEKEIDEVEAGANQPEKELNQVDNTVSQDTINNAEKAKDEVSQKGIGGSYGEVREHVEKTGAENKEVHHMPADSVSPIERNDGPAIEMDKDDHRQTASCGSSREAREYRAEQRAKIEKGDFDGAFQMDVDDLHDKFGDKYDDQIEQAREYKEKLKQEGRI